jgi:hypothetical protein
VDKLHPYDAGRCAGRNLYRLHRATNATVTELAANVWNHKSDKYPCIRRPRGSIPGKRDERAGRPVFAFAHPGKESGALLQAPEILPMGGRVKGGGGRYVWLDCPNSCQPWFAVITLC